MRASFPLCELEPVHSDTDSSRANSNSAHLRRLVPGEVVIELCHQRPRRSASACLADRSVTRFDSDWEGLPAVSRGVPKRWAWLENRDGKASLNQNAFINSKSFSQQAVFLEGRKLFSPGFFTKYFC